MLADLGADVIKVEPPRGEIIRFVGPFHPDDEAKAYGARFAFRADALPALDGALGLARAGVETGGAAHNRRFVAGSLQVGRAVAPELVVLAHDPQTSGGLLAAVGPDRFESVAGGLGVEGTEWWEVGLVEAGAPGVALA